MPRSQLARALRSGRPMRGCRLPRDPRVVRFRDELRDAAVVLAMALADAAVHLVPRPILRGGVAWISRVLVSVSPRRVRWARINLALALPALRQSEREQLLLVSLVHWAANFVDLIRMRRYGRDEVLAHADLAGADHLRAALAHGRGALLIVPHLGHFELGLQRLAVEGFAPVVVQRPAPGRRLNRVLSRLRTRHGVELVDRAGALGRMRRALRKGRVVVATFDHDPGRSRTALMVPFFGLRVPTSAAIAWLAAHTGAPVLPCYVVRDAVDHHRATLLPPILAPAIGVASVDLTLTTAVCMAAIEDIIRRHPAEWMWSYRRFRRSPDLGADPYRAR